MLFVFTGLSCFGQEKPGAVIFNGIGEKDGALINCPGISLEKEYGIVVHKYWPEKEYVEELLKRVEADDAPNISGDEWAANNKDIYKPIDENFVSDLAKSGLLYIGQHAHESASIPFRKYPAAVKKFLARGGIIFFDYCSTKPALNDFLESVNVENPSKEYKPGDYAAIPWPGPGSTNTSLLNTPYILSNQQFNAYGWWGKWADNQSAPFRNEREPQKGAAMIIQANVLGQGKIIFNQVACIFRDIEDGSNKKIRANTLSYIFKRNITKYRNEMIAEQGGPGEPSR